MRMLLYLFLSFTLTSFTSLADGSTPSSNKAFFEQKLQKVGQKIDQTAEKVKEKVETTAKKVEDKTAEEKKTFPGRVKAAFHDIGDGFSRAWKKITGKE